MMNRDSKSLGATVDAKACAITTGEEQHANCGKFDLCKRGAVIGRHCSALVEFHPALEGRFHTHRSVDSLEVPILDVLHHAVARVNEDGRNDFARSRSHGRRSDHLHDVRRVFQDRITFKVE